MTIRIVTDSTSDLPASLAAKYGITVLPAYVNIGEASYQDGIDLSRQAFYEKLPQYETPPTTAAPAVGTFTAAYEQLAAEGATEILSIHLAANLSSILNAARLGSEATSSVRVRLFDSRQISMGVGFMALSAAKAAAAGNSMSQIVEELEEQVQRTYVFAVLDTLEYLRRGGRVSWTEFGLGTLLRIKPIVRVYNGAVESLEKVRTHSHALRHMVEHANSLGPLQDVALLHTANPQGVEKLREQVRHLQRDGDEAIAVEATPAIGAHVGPGALGLACVAGAS